MGSSSTQMTVDEKSDTGNTTLLKEISSEPDKTEIIAGPVTTELSSATVVKKKQAPNKAKKRKKKPPKDASAPKHPLTGYVRYMNDRKDEIRKQNPGMGFQEVTRLIADEWTKLIDDQKKPYLDAAEIDRERYNKELDEYKQNEAKRSVPTASTPVSIEKTEKLTPEKIHTNGKENQHTEKIFNIPKAGDYDIPIFTDEFLEHNKAVDTELRLLRKSNIDYEQQNSVLEKHVENMRNGIDKLQTETTAMRDNNLLLQNYLDKLKSKLASALSGLSIPTELNGASLQNIEKYMSDLHAMSTSNSHGPASLNKAKDIIRKLDLHIQV